MRRRLEVAAVLAFVGFLLAGVPGAAVALAAAFVGADAPDLVGGYACGGLVAVAAITVLERFPSRAAPVSTFVATRPVAAVGGSLVGVLVLVTIVLRAQAEQADRVHPPASSDAPDSGRRRSLRSALALAAVAVLGVAFTSLVTQPVRPWAVAVVVAAALVLVGRAAGQWSGARRAEPEAGAEPSATHSDAD